MFIYPAIDLLDGRCVRLLQGDYSRETVFSDDPAAVAWRDRTANRMRGATAIAKRLRREGVVHRSWTSAEAAAGAPIARAAQQPVWRDPGTGLRRTMVSPPNTGSRMELVLVDLPAGADIRRRVEGLAGLVRDLTPIAPGALKVAV